MLSVSVRVDGVAIGGEDGNVLECARVVAVRAVDANGQIEDAVPFEELRDGATADGGLDGIGSIEPALTVADRTGTLGNRPANWPEPQQSEEFIPLVILTGIKAGAKLSQVYGGNPQVITCVHMGEHP